MWIMLVLLVLCFCITSSIQIPEDARTISEPAGGNIALPCGHFSSKPIPVKFKLEMGSHQSWMTLEVKSLILKLETLAPSLLLPANANRSRAHIYSCSVDNRKTSEHTRGTERNNVTFDPGKDEWVFCNATKNWTSLSWSRDGDVIAVVKRGRCPLNIEVVGNGTSLYVTNITQQDSGNYSCSHEGWQNVTCSWVDLQNAATGFQLFMEERYWIIVATALSYLLLCLMIISVYMYTRRKRRAKKQVKVGFFKASTARNLYVDSLTQDPDVNQKPQELTYQNVSLTLPKNVNGNSFSDKSSFSDQSFDGGSYLQPDEGDQISNGDGYENTIPEVHVTEGSLDGDCYENAGEEIKDVSEGRSCVTGSVSYEDMQGPIAIRTRNEEDGDSYENMESTLYALPHQSLKSLNKSIEEQSVDRAPCQRQWNGTTELKQQNGDFYLSYESNKL
ncbi:uncharacterized protein LOC142097330 isoform X2 [Mixophyes fleayi]|uniref:uncharacterized protein LOC142097330 isoform X2 n=1 Tax=Mixophyes fleayi TaxID=3061075 RepID=UPI003F4DC99B